MRGGPGTGRQGIIVETYTPTWMFDPRRLQSAPISAQ
jgi:hypothetical protein